MDPVLGKVLVLVVMLTLPVINAVGTQYFLDFVTYFHLSPITDKLGGVSLCPDLVFKCVDELLIGLDGIDICHKRLHIKKT